MGIRLLFKILNLVVILMKLIVTLEVISSCPWLWSDPYMISVLGSSKDEEQSESMCQIDIYRQFYLCFLTCLCHVVQTDLRSCFLWSWWILYKTDNVILLCNLHAVGSLGLQIFGGLWFTATSPPTICSDYAIFDLTNIIC